MDLTQSPHQPPGPTSWAPVQRESRTVRPISRVPRSATDSGSSIHPRDSVDRAAAGPFQRSRARLHALLKVLRRFLLSQSSAGAEKFENASSKFRWNPSALQPSTIAPVRGERPDVGHSSPFPKTKHAKVTPGVAWPVSWALERGCKTVRTSAHASTEPPSSFEVSDQSSHPEKSALPSHARTS